MSWNFTENYFGINKRYWAKKIPEVGRGGHSPPGRARPPWRALVGCGLLGPPLVPIFWYITGFDLEKNIVILSGRCAAVSRWNLGRSTFALWQSDSAGDTSLREGISMTSSSPTTLSLWEDQSSSTSSPSPSYLKPYFISCVQSLYQNLRLVPVGD